MKKIPTKVHGILDYALAFILLCAPTVGSFSDHILAAGVCVILGPATIAISMFTKYEHGPFGRIPMKVHLLFDKIFAVLLIVSPWLFGFAETVFIPHVAIGAFALGIALMSERNVPQAEKDGGAPVFTRKKGNGVRSSLYKLYGRSVKGMRR